VLVCCNRITCFYKNVPLVVSLSPEGVFSVTRICSRMQGWPACVIFHAAGHTQLTVAVAYCTIFFSIVKLKFCYVVALLGQISSMM
jgi:hypothetical protein